MLIILELKNKVLTFLKCLILKEKTQLGEGQREKWRERIPSRRHDSSEPYVGFELTNCEIMTWAEVGYSTDGATQLCQRINLLILHYKSVISIAIITIWYYVAYILIYSLFVLPIVCRLHEEKDYITIFLVTWFI